MKSSDFFIYLFIHFYLNIAQLKTANGKIKVYNGNFSVAFTLSRL